MASGGLRSTSFKPGHKSVSRGRPKGSKDKTPRSVVAIMRDVVAKEGPAIRAAIVAGVTSRAPKSFMYLQLLAHYIDGKPADHVRLTGPDDGPVQFDLTGLSVEELRALRPILQKLEQLKARSESGE